MTKNSNYFNIVILLRKIIIVKSKMVRQFYARVKNFSDFDRVL